MQSFSAAIEIPKGFSHTLQALSTHSIITYSRRRNHRVLRMRALASESFTRKPLSDHKFDVRLPKYLYRGLRAGIFDRSTYEHYIFRTFRHLV